MNKTLLFLCLLILIGGGACTKTPTLAPLGPDELILAFGDSITSGAGANPDESYPAQLEKLIGHKVINAGVSGEMVEQGVERLPKSIDEQRPSIAIICHGGNNFLQGQDDGHVKENIRSMIQIARARNVQVVLVGVPKPGLILRDAAIYGELAKEFSVPYRKNVLSRILSNPALKADQIHPNAEGYTVFAQAIAELLVNRGAIKMTT